VAEGALPYLYEGSPNWVAGPLLPIVLAPVAAIGSLFGLSQSVPYLIRYPTIWLVYGPYGMGLLVVPLIAMRRLAVQIGVRTSLLRLQLATTILILIPTGMMWMHLEDVLALACMLFAARETLRGRDTRAALMIGLAIGFKQWALLGLPIVVAAAPEGRRLRTLAAGVAVPAGAFGLPLLLDWHWAAPAILSAKAFPITGHAALWEGGAVSTVGTPFRSLSVLSAIAVGWRLRGRVDPRTLMAGFASVLVIRLAFEPVLFGYYPCPALAFLLFHELVRTGRLTRTFLFGLAALLVFAFHPHPVVWWTVEVALLAPIAWPALADALALPRIRRRTLVPAA
jgi:hypothetical protein